jgi:hypothetical protein
LLAGRRRRAGAASGVRGLASGGCIRGQSTYLDSAFHFSGARGKISLKVWPLCAWRVAPPAAVGAAHPGGR